MLILNANDPFAYKDYRKRLVYNGLDCLLTKEIHQNLMADLQPEHEAAYAFQMAVTAPLIHAGLKGCRIDQKEREKQLNLFSHQLTRLGRFIAAKIRQLVPEQDWLEMVVGEKLAKGTLKEGSVPYNRIVARYHTTPLSPGDNAKTELSKPLFTTILYNYLGLPEKKGKNKKSKSGRSVDDEALFQLLKEKKTEKVGATTLLRACLLYTKLDKQASYLRGPFRRKGKDERFTYVIQTGKETFRIAAKKDPVGVKEGVEV